MNVSEFSRNPGSELAEVDRTELPLPITTRGRDQYCTVVPTHHWERAERALSIVQGLMAIARADQGRAEDCGRYRGFAEMLFALDDQLQVSSETDREAFVALLHDLAGQLQPQEVTSPPLVRMSA